MDQGNELLRCQLWSRARMVPRITFRWSSVIRRAGIPPQQTLTGESCANYMFHPLAPEHTAATLPHAKVIFLLRNPVDRAFSRCRLGELHRRQETLSFDDAIDAEPERLAV